jgi:protein TonB
MYYATKRNNTQTRAVGAATVVLVNIGAAIAIANGFGSTFFKPPVESEVVMIEEPKVVEDEPPPPPPIDVDLPPPPPQVILPDFIADVPPQENAITKVESTPKPAPPPAVRPAPAPRPALPPVRPQANMRRFQDMLTDKYPQQSRRLKEEGDVTVSMCMSADGRASDVKLVQSSGYDRLDDVTVREVARLPFTPAKDSSGKPTAWCPPTYPAYQLTVSWRLPK